jgi:Leucine-rich repeat (LRR) protein
MGETARVMLTIIFLVCALIPTISGETIELKCDEIKVLSYYERYYGTKCTISNVTADSSASFAIRTSNSFEYNKLIQDVEFVSGSQLYDVPREVFSTFQFLKKLQANNVGIEEISKYNFNYATNLLELRLRSNRVKKLPNSVFVNVIQLESLDLCSNEITEIEKNALAGMENLQYLTLSDNKIMRLDESLFRDLKSLTSIRLDSNKLQVVEGSWFVSTESLTEIRIDSNEIATINDDEAFGRLRKLRLLNLGNNRLQKLNVAETTIEKLWIAQNSLKHLKLNKNLKLLYAPINELKHINFNGNTELIEIKLRQNHINDISNLSSLTKVEVLDISVNPINMLNVASFARMPDLVRLNLEFTNISSESLTFGTFAHNANLSQLDLSYNQLRHIDFNIFTALAQLTLLNIDGNNLTQIPHEKMRNYFPKLAMIGISDNDWNCTYLAGMIKQLKQINVVVRVIARTRVLNETNVDGIRCVANNQQRHVEWSDPVVHDDDDELSLTPRVVKSAQRDVSQANIQGVWSKISSLEVKIMALDESMRNYRQQMSQHETLKLQQSDRQLDSQIVQSEVSFIKVVLCFMCLMMVAFMLLTIVKFVKTYMAEHHIYFPSENFRRSTATIQTTMEHVM